MTSPIPQPGHEQIRPRFGEDVSTLKRESSNRPTAMMAVPAMGNNPVLRPVRDTIWPPTIEVISRIRP